jgi:acetylornithine deacetylase/succinyl-diaminopimelate desuccinylase family protein
MKKKNSDGFLPVDMDYLKDLTKKMIEIPSPPGKERKIAIFIASELEKIGINNELQTVGKNTSNVIARINGKSKQSIMFQGHMDTIPAYGWRDAFLGMEKEGMIYGRGSVDMKSSLACVITAMRSIVESGMTPEKSIVLACTVDEEAEKKGIFKLVEKGIDAGMAVCCEPTDLKIGIGHKGYVPLRVSTKGKATHGSTPEAGINAIYRMKRILDFFEKNWKTNEQQLEGIGKVFGTYSVGVIQGGDNFMVVPDWCHIWVDRRTIPGETKEDVNREVEEFLNLIRDGDPDFQYQVAIHKRPDWEWPKIIERGLKAVVISSEEEIVRLASSAYRKVISSDPEIAFLMFWTEADFLVNESRIPTIIFGPGEPEKAHSITECVSINQLEMAAKIYLDLMIY